MMNKTTDSDTNWLWLRIAAIVPTLLLLVLMPDSASAQGGTAMRVRLLNFNEYEKKSGDLNDYDLRDIRLNVTCWAATGWPYGSEIIVVPDGTINSECTSGNDTEKSTGTLKGKVDFKTGQVTFNAQMTREYRLPFVISDGQRGNKKIGWGTNVGKIQTSYQATGTLTSDKEGKGTISFSYSCSSTYTDIKGDVPYGPGSNCPGSKAKQGDKVGTDTGSGTGTTTWTMMLEPTTTPTTQATVCQAPPRITAQQIDAYLDFLAAQLQFAVEKAETYIFEPFVMDARPFRFTPKDAADLGRAVWDQVHALQKKHVEREVTLNDAQKKRTKAFGHWADWLERRAKTQKKTFRGDVIEVYEQPEKPPYPLFGSIAQDVPTPPQLKGEDIFVVNVPWWGPEAITDDYAWAGFWTVAQGADMWYTRGLFWTTYIALSNESIAPVALSALQRIPYFGPAFTATFVTAVEVNAWTEIGLLRRYFGEAPLTWDQHLANYASLTNLGTAATVRTFPSLNRVSKWAGGVDEGKLGADITAKFGQGKSSRVISERTDAQGNQYQKIEYALLGPTKANPDNKLSFPTDEFRVINTKEGSRYFTVKANGELDQPVFFLGQKGYHTWKHLTEINAGQKTKYEDESLLNVFAGKKDYLAELKAIEKTMLDPTQSLDTANNQYIAFTNRLIADKSFTRISGFYQWKNRDGSLAPTEANFFIMVPKDCGANAPVATFPVRVSVDPTNGRLMGLFVLKPHDPTAAFMPEAKTSVAPSAYWAWARDVDKYLYEFAPLRNYMPAR